MLATSETPWGSGLHIAGISKGGLLGSVLYTLSLSYLRSVGAWLLWIFLLLIGLQLMCGHSWPGVAQRAASGIARAWRWLKDVLCSLPWLRKSSPREVRAVQKAPSGQTGKAKNQTGKQSASGVSSKSATPSTTSKQAPAASESGETKGYPGADLLAPLPEKGSTAEEDELEELSERLTACLLDFGVKGELMDVQPGPVVTMFEFKPAPGVKISRIANLSDDLALALKAYAVRIVAPIPGKDMVGIEVPNRKRQTVYFREIIQSFRFSRAKASLPMALGHTIEGSPRVEDLAELPHLLIAGATGTGKSVCLNGVILSLIFRASPEEVKLLLIDPKRIELAAYGDLPHLVHPVVTDMDLAKAALDWAIQEMERRYEAMASLSVRNIESYNRKLEELRKKDPQEAEGREQLPYLVIIIDEMADLMLTAGKEAESNIVRLAQLARAAGIHIILATQRPSVDVVTGLIKANFPARIAFQVSSKHDSRTILDAGGAEYLLGKGDLLFKSSAGRLERMHGPFLSDDEISAVIGFWSRKRPQAGSDVDLHQYRNESGSGSQGAGSGDIADDPLYDQAVNFVLEQGKASISMIQRHLRIGFNRAARYVEQMEQDGIVGPQDGSKPRMVNRS